MASKEDQSPTLLFVYACPEGFSGRKEATELLIRNIDRSEWDIESLPLPAYEKVEGRNLPQLVRAAGGVLYSLFRTIRYAGQNIVIHLNLGQSMASMIRAGLPFLLLRFLATATSSVVALHGSTFMEWTPRDWTTTHFLFLLSRSDRITVLGPNQEKRLSSLGVSEEKIEILPNTCTFPSIDRDDLLAKHEEAPPVRVMYLGLLIQTKGYFRYLEALELLAECQNLPEIEAVLAGPISTHEGEGVFADPEKTRAAIQEKIESINASPHVDLVWNEWVEGKEKVQLYHNTHVFVFPSLFSVEAQPLVLMEAMSSGCAIITSKTGEIPYQLDHHIGSQLDAPTSRNVAEALRAYVGNNSRRKQAALEGWAHFHDEFSKESHLSKWDRVFKSLRSSLN